MDCGKLGTIYGISITHLQVISKAYPILLTENLLHFCFTVTEISFLYSLFQLVSQHKPALFEPLSIAAVPYEES